MTLEELLDMVQDASEGDHLSAHSLEWAIKVKIAKNELEEEQNDALDEELANIANERECMISLIEAKNLGLVEHLEFTMPNERLDTQWGNIPTSLWMVYERDRILSSAGRRAEIVQKEGKIALFVDNIGGWV